MDRRHYDHPVMFEPPVGFLVPRPAAVPTLRESPISQLHMNVLAELMARLPLMDVISFASTSRTHYRIFLLFRSEILTRWVKNLYRRCNREVFYILHYQRPSTPLHPIESLPGDFVVGPADIQNLFRNHRLYLKIADTFFEQQLTFRYANGPYHAFNREEYLSISRFFVYWLHSIRFQYDTIATFAQRKRLGDRLVDGLEDFSSAVVKSGCYDEWRRSTAGKNMGLPEHMRVPDMCVSYAEFLPIVLTRPEHRVLADGVIRMKIVQHLIIHVLLEHPVRDWETVKRSPGLKALVVSVMDEFGAGGEEIIDRITEEYGLEFEDPAEAAGLAD